MKDWQKLSVLVVLLSVTGCVTTPIEVDVQPRSACLAFEPITDVDSRQVAGHNAAYEAYCGGGE